MDHVLLTRFNLPSKGNESFVRARPGWLTNRVELFERFCLPSVLAQTDKRFKWLVYFDPESPDWLKERIDVHAAAGHYRPVLREEVSRPDLVDDLAGLFEVRGHELTTTNLDNDDALARDFVERLHAEPPPGTAVAYYFTHGLIRSPTGLYRVQDRHNAFVSVREGWASPVTCWADWHNRLPRQMPAVEIGGPPGWLQVVHGGNVSNRTRGRLVPAARYGTLFGDLLDGVETPSRGAMVRDRIVHLPVRMARDTARLATRTLVIGLGGTRGLDRAKELAAARRRRR